MRLAFVGIGVRVPGTDYRLRNVRPGRSLVESASGDESVALPDGWQKGLLVFATGLGHA